jgi:hypothetical protein
MARLYGLSINYYITIFTAAFLFAMTSFSAPDLNPLVCCNNNMIPYSIFWEVLDWPVFLGYNHGNWLFPLWISALASFLGIIAARKTPTSLFTFYEASMMWWSMNGWLNISITMIAMLGPVSLLATLASILVKLPIGYWPPFTNPHWLYAFPGGDPFSVGSNYRFHTPIIIEGYALLVIGWVLPILLKANRIGLFHAIRQVLGGVKSHARPGGN